MAFDRSLLLLFYLTNEKIREARRDTRERMSETFLQSLPLVQPAIEISSLLLYTHSLFFLFFHFRFPTLLYFYLKYPERINVLDFLPLLSHTEFFPFFHLAAVYLLFFFFDGLLVLRCVLVAQQSLETRWLPVLREG